jgi:peptide/nickel transport system ATP-binding protein
VRAETPVEEPLAASPLLEVRGLVKHFPLPHTLLDVALRRAPERVRAVDGVSLTLGRGQTLGLVGESGCGKSTLGRCLLRLHDADRGEVRFDGVDLMKLGEAELAPYRKRMQVVFQDPYASLDPRQRVAAMLREVLDVHGIGAPSTRYRRVDELLLQVGLSPADGHKYPGEFSGGQRQRVGIARALAVEPELLIADEPLSALDVSIQAQILQLLLDLRASLGLTIIFISHDLRVVRYLSDEVAVMYLGTIVEHAPTVELFARPQHPYTVALLSAVPEVGGVRRELAPIEGEPPSAVRLPSGCRFHPRCPWQVERCHRESPQLDVLLPHHHVACHVAADRLAGCRDGDLDTDARGARMREMPRT